MKIKKFNEKYEIDGEGEIAEEMAKIILSEYLDRKIDDVTLEDVFRDIIDGDELDETQEYIIKQELMDLTYNINQDAHKIRNKTQIEADKYNL